MLSDLIEQTILETVNQTVSSDIDNPFERLLSMGELVDRLTIVNIKLYNLKNEVMRNHDKSFRAWASEQDVLLVEERARLKKCIDLKLITVIADAKCGKTTFNPEVKKYA